MHTTYSPTQHVSPRVILSHVSTVCLFSNCVVILSSTISPNKKNNHENSFARNDMKILDCRSMLHIFNGCHWPILIRHHLFPIEEGTRFWIVTDAIIKTLKMYWLSSPLLFTSCAAQCTFNLREWPPFSLPKELTNFLRALLHSLPFLHFRVQPLLACPASGQGQIFHATSSLPSSCVLVMLFAPTNISTICLWDDMWS